MLSYYEAAVNMFYKGDVPCKLEIEVNPYTALKWFPFYPVEKNVVDEIRYDLKSTQRQSYLFVRLFKSCCL